MTKSTTNSKKVVSKKVAKPRATAGKKVAKKSTKKTGSEKTTPTKKTTASAAKKSTTTTSSAKKAAGKKRPVVEAPNDKSFWTTDGQVLNTIVALNEALNIMHDTVYEYHVGKDRHDFADWVETVLEDPDCAAALRKAKSPKAAQTVVVRHLKYYSL